MPSMTLMISAISSDDFSISLIAITARPTTVSLSVTSARAASTTLLVSRAAAAVVRTCEVISSIAAAVSSRLAACCSVRRDRSSEAVLISPEPVRTSTALLATADSVVPSLSMAALKSTRTRS
ncbi:hypothetical protein WR25_15787 [Diploscapter pachys]|uniref:Uncharacterized protein n=1 Tax=Diploscapter pachys TaxID=2018661 RepID=A0A2A2JXC4_9BILA|nr:hypothetical protein WR25_15787 [Diploscapter pachys]